MMINIVIRLCDAMGWLKRPVAEDENLRRHLHNVSCHRVFILHYFSPFCSLCNSITYYVDHWVTLTLTIAPLCALKMTDG